MRVSSTIAAALGVTPFVTALPSANSRDVAPDNSLTTRHSSIAWSRSTMYAADMDADAKAALRARRVEAATRRRARRAASVKIQDTDSDDSGDDSDADRGKNGNGNGAGNGAGSGAGADAGAGAGAGAGDAAGGEEGENKGTFGTLIDLQSGDLKQDTLFTATVGNFEVEFSAKTARKLAVLENKAPGAAPAGFKLLNPSSFLVALQGGGGNLTLGQIDFQFDVTNPALANLDLTQTTVGKFNNALGVFEVGAAAGETEFEADENKVVLKVTSLAGEFAIFIPDTATTPAAPATPAASGAPTAPTASAVPRGVRETFDRRYW